MLDTQVEKWLLNNQPSGQTHDLTLLLLLYIYDL